MENYNPNNPKYEPRTPRYGEINEAINRSIGRRLMTGLPIDY